MLLSICLVILFNYFSLIQVFFQSFQTEIIDLPDSLQALSSLLPAILRDAKASSTTGKYYNEFQKWIFWTTSHGISNQMPAQPLIVAIYLASIIQHSSSPAPVLSAYYGLRWAHNLVGTTSPTDANLVKNILEAAKRRLAHPCIKKEPMTPELLKTYYDSLSKPINLKDLRSLCMFIIAFAGFLRSAEVLNLKSHDILFHDTHVSLFIQKSKTDIYREGSWVILSKTASNLCPVKILHNYLSLGKIKNDSDEYIFRNLQKNKSGFTLRKENKPMT